MARILFFAHDMGGANAIFPLISELRKHNEVLVSAKGTAIKRLPLNVEYEEDLLTKTNPDLLITGTSANDFTEKHLWSKAKSKGIKSVAILDSWMNYGVRFSGFGLKDIDKFANVCDFLPNYIIVMDDFAKSEAIEEGVPSKLIYALGNPHFAFVKEQGKNTENIRSRFVKEDEKLILFASEPRFEDYGFGFELKALSDLLDVLPSNAKVVIRPHPKERKEKFQNFNAIVDNETDFYEMIKASDIVVSLTSMVLIEAMILNIPIVSYQPFKSDKDKFILTRRALIPFISDKDTLRKAIKNPLKVHEDFIKYDALEKINNFIQKKCL